MPPKFSRATERFMGDMGALSVADFQQQIAERTKELALELLALHRRHNAVNPSHRLPPEILSRIFTILSSEWTWWIRITHICHYWRVVALDCADLWSKITFSNIGFTKAKVARSRDLPLTMTAKPTTPASHDHLALALASPNRLRHVSVEGSATTYQALLASWAIPCPTLETLSLKLQPSILDCLPEGFTQGPAGVPSLTTLDLAFCGTAWRNLPLGHSITTLRLCEGASDVFGVTTYRHRPSVREFLQSMKNMPRLRVLRLHGILPLQEPPSSLSSSPLHFPVLQNLDVGDRAEYIAQLFSLVRIRHCTSYIQLNFVGPGMTRQDERAVVSSALHHFKRSLGLDGHILVHEIEMSYPTYRFSSPDTSQSDSRITEVSTSLGEYDNHDLSIMFSGIFELSTTHSVKVNAESEPTLRLFETWQYLNITTIELTGRVPACLFGLLKARIPPSILGPKPAYFPALASLSFKDIIHPIEPGSEEAELWRFTQHLIEAFRERGKLLCPLPELHIKGFKGMGASEADRIRKALPKLKLAFA